jgi:hypothetical protein
VGILLAVALGSWLARPTESQPGVAASPTPLLSPAPTPGVQASATAVPTATSASTAVDRDKIYLARPAGPPIAVSWLMSGGAVISPGERIAVRLNGLAGYQQSVPGLTNYLAKNNFGSPGGSSAQVTIATDLATVDLHLGAPLNANAHSEAVGILQQLVYTATEEPGIRRVLFTQNGGQLLSIGDIKVDKPLAREDVFGYSVRGSIGRDQGIKGGGDTSPVILGSSVVTSNDGTLVTLTVEPRDADGKAARLPPFEVWMDVGDDRSPTGGKYALNVSLLWNVTGSTGGAAHVNISDQTPLRATVDATAFWRLELDDARPWRAYISPTGTKLTVEVGGDPRATSDRISVTSPQAESLVPPLGNATSRTSRVVGSARVFEATVSWRIRDSAGKTVANGHFLASLGSSALWGTFDTQIPIAANVSGNVTLELYEASPKDGSEQGMVAIPFTVR